MKNHKSVLLGFTFLILILLPLRSISQTDFRPGYYIGWENDTIYGLMDYRSEIRNSKFCVFKSEVNSEPIKFKPEEIHSYRFIDDKYYISRQIETKEGSQHVFLEFLLNGITNLYFYNSLNNYSYYIEDREGNLIELKKEKEMFYLEGKGNVVRHSFKHIGLLKATFADCMEIQPDIDNIDLTHKSLINLTKSYHDYVCDDEECIIYEKKLPAIKIQFAPFFGMGISTFYTDKDFHPNFNFEPDDFNSVGILFNTIIPRVSEKLSMQIEAQAYKNDFYLYKEFDRGAFIEISDIHINTVSLQSSIAIKYTYQKGKIRPSIAMGILYNYFMKYDTKFIQTREYSSAIFTSDFGDFPIGTNKWGGLIQLGCNYRIFKNRELFTHFRFSRFSGKEPYISPEPINLKNSIIRKYLTQINFSVGMYLNKM